MSADPFGRVAFGEPVFPALGARWFNAVSDAAVDLKRRKLGRPGAPLEAGEEAALVVALCGGSPAGDQPGHKVYSLDGGTAASDLAGRPFDFRRDPVFTGGRHVSPYELTYAFASAAPGLTSFRPVVSVEPVTNGGLGRAVLAGVAVCDVEIVDGTHQYCAPMNGQHRFRSRKTGVIPILARESGTGVKKCAVLLGYNDPPPAVSQYRFDVYVVPTNVTAPPPDTAIDIDPGEWHLTLTFNALVAAGTPPNGGASSTFLNGGFGQYHSVTNVPLGVSSLPCAYHLYQRPDFGGGVFVTISEGGLYQTLAFHRVVRVANAPARFAPYFFVTNAGSPAGGASIRNVCLTAVRIRAFGSATSGIWNVNGDAPQNPPAPGPAPELLAAYEEDEDVFRAEEQTHAARIAGGGILQDKSFFGGID